MEGEQREDDVNESTSSGSSQSQNEHVAIDESLNLPIALRKSKHGVKYAIRNYVSYKCLSPSYRAFVASLQSISIPTDWKAAKQDPKWRQAMMEELDALRKNKTWELSHLPEGKKAPSCKWIYTIK
jgi:hypothetical protein